MGREYFHFARHRFEIVESDLTRKSSHRVALTYESDTMSLYGIIGEYMILAYGDRSTNLLEEPVETFLLKMQPHLSIVQWKETNAWKNKNEFAF